jgi:hypothetical protein
VPGKWQWVVYEPPRATKKAASLTGSDALDALLASFLTAGVVVGLWVLLSSISLLLAIGSIAAATLVIFALAFRVRDKYEGLWSGVWIVCLTVWPVAVGALVLVLGLIAVCHQA